MLGIALSLVAGCASNQISVDPVYFPSPPAVPRVVHLKSFNRLSDLAPPRRSRGIFRRRESVASVGTPAGLAYRDGHLYICDTTLGVVHDWNLATGEGRRFGDRGDIRLSKPVAVAVDADGSIYVADTQRGEVVLYDGSGRSIRRYRRNDGEGYRPVAVAVAGATLYVADISAHRIDVFSTSAGSVKGGFGGVGDSPGRLYYPMGVATDAAGRIYVSDMMNARVQIFDANQSPIGSFGQPGNRYGDLGKPRHLVVAPDGVIFVTDAEFAHVHLFNDRGQLLMLFGGPEDLPGGTPMPIGVALAASVPDQLKALVPPEFRADYFVFVANSIGGRRMSLFAVGMGQ